MLIITLTLMVFKSNTAKLKNFVKTFWSVFRSRAKNINLSCNCQCQCPELIFAVFQSLLIDLQFVFYCIQQPKLLISSSFPGSSSRDPIVLLLVQPGLQFVAGATCRLQCSQTHLPPTSYKLRCSQICRTHLTWAGWGPTWTPATLLLYSH